MQALERISTNNSWFTIVLVGILVLIFLLKKLDKEKLKGFVYNLISKNYVEEEYEEGVSLLNPFQAIIAFVAILNLSLLILSILQFYSGNFSDGFSSFLMVFSATFAYFILKWTIEYVLAIILVIKKEVRFFFVSKFMYLCAISFLLLVGLIVVEYANLSVSFLAYFAIGLFSFRFLLLVLNNKNLIFSHLFYFILYLCAFEIAPLLILFKLMF